MISEPVTAGTVQVPPDGQPIVLMADRQTTGGYPKIASVASVDLRLLAQMAAPQALRLQLISLADAQSIYLAREREYSHVRQVMAHALEDQQHEAAIDLNCDMGESFGPWKMGNDVAILDHVTSANIACGFHAGDPLTMQGVVKAALRQGGGGRRASRVPGPGGLRTTQHAGDSAPRRMPSSSTRWARYRRLRPRRWAARLNHVKAHGALYNMAAQGPRLADAIARAVRDVDPAWCSSAWPAAR